MKTQDIASNLIQWCKVR